LWSLALFDLLERHGARHDVNQELQVVEMCYCVCWGALEWVGLRGGEGEVQRSRYWMFRRGFRSDFTTLWPCSARYWINISCCGISMLGGRSTFSGSGVLQ
jgi:hypothetical protein